MKTNDYKIGTQLKIGFGIILFFGILLSVTAWMHTDRIAQEVSKMYNHPLQVRRAIGEIKSDVLSIHRGMKDLVISVDEFEAAQILAEIDKYDADAFSKIEVLKSRYLGP